MPMEDTYGIQSRIGSIIVVERWYCCRGSPVFTDRNIQVLDRFFLLWAQIPEGKVDHDVPVSVILHGHTPPLYGGVLRAGIQCIILLGESKNICIKLFEGAYTG